MIGDKSKHSIREIQKIGTVKNRPIEVLPYEKEINNNLAVVFKANNYNDREIIVEESDFKEINIVGNNVTHIPYEPVLVLNMAESAFNEITLKGDILIDNIINLSDGCNYQLIINQDSVGGHKFITNTENITIFMNKKKNLNFINTDPNTTTIINFISFDNILYGEVFETSNYVEENKNSFEFNIRLTSPDLTFTLPIAENYIHNFTVDWGDTNTNQITSFDSPDITHTYLTAGDYTVKITGVCEYFAFNNLGDKLKMLSLIGFKGDCGFKVLNFNGCTNLTGSIPTNFTYLSNLETAESLFNGCQNLTGAIPENMFWNSKKINSFNFAFTSCKNITGSIPEKLFWNNPEVIDFSGVFAYCINLTGAIPEKIFWYNPRVKSVFYAFGSNTANGNMNLSGELPYKILYNLPELENCSTLFQRCVNLIGEIPEDFLYNNPNLIDCSSLFTSCINLTGSIPEKLFWYNSKINNLFACFSYCTGLTGSIPEKLLWNNPKLINLTSLFISCANLTGSIPEKLFWYNTKVVSVGYIFQLCSGLTGSIPEKLLYNCPEITDVRSLFDRSGVSGILPENLFINNKKINKFDYAFWSRNTLTGRGWEKIINDAEQNAINGGFTITKTQCFRNCTGLEDYALIPAAWR